MSYPLINGGAINGGSGGTQTEGIDLVTTGEASASYLLDAGGDEAMQYGGITMEFTLAPGGIDLVESGTHAGLYNALIYPAGIELVTIAPAMAYTAADAASANPLQIGTPRAKTGSDVAIKPYGIELSRAGSHVALADQPAPNLSVQVISSRPLELGDLKAVPATIYADAQSAYPMGVGAPSTRRVALSADISGLLEVGNPSSGVYVVSAGVAALRLGLPSAAFSALAAGLDLARGGTHLAIAGGLDLFSESAYPMEIGAPSDFEVALTARQSFPMQVGQPAIYRGTTC